MFVTQRDAGRLVGLLTLCRSKPLTDFRSEGGNPGCTPKSCSKQRLSNNETSAHSQEAQLLRDGDKTEQNRCREGASSSKLHRYPPYSFLLISLSRPPTEINSGNQAAAVTLHTELQQTRGVAFSTKVWNHAACCCCCCCSASLTAPLPPCKITVMSL